MSIPESVSNLQQYPISWTRTEINTGRIVDDNDIITLSNLPSEKSYTNAQITDYDYQSFDFQWQAPLRMSLQARSSACGAELHGTAGFGFWNHPFSPDVIRLRLPQAIWFFFASPPSNIKLALDVNGHGWKAATIDAGRKQALWLTPLSVPALLMMQIPTLYQRLYSPIQRAMAIGEAVLDDTLLSEWHTYTIDWLSQRAIFRVDEKVVLDTPFAPRGVCGFCAWIDNQYAVITPQGKLGAGTIPINTEQSLSLKEITIKAGDYT